MEDSKVALLYPLERSTLFMENYDSENIDSLLEITDFQFSTHRKITIAALPTQGAPKRWKRIHNYLIFLLEQYDIYWDCSHPVLPLIPR